MAAGKLCRPFASRAVANSSSSSQASVLWRAAQVYSPSLQEAKAQRACIQSSLGSEYRAGRLSGGLFQKGKILLNK